MRLNFSTIASIPERPTVLRCRSTCTSKPGCGALENPCEQTKRPLNLLAVQPLFVLGTYSTLIAGRAFDRGNSLSQGNTGLRLDIAFSAA
jgi:hypothetical protein